MRSLGTWIRTALYLTVIVIVFCACVIPVLIIATLPARWRFALRPFYWISQGVYYLLIASWLVPVKITGRHHIPKTGPLIFVANHQSAVDIPLLGILARGQPHVWMVWHELAQYPFFGYLLKSMFILVDTRSPRRALGAVAKAESLNEHHLMIFPEGGRYTDGTIHHFFRGFALVAERTGRPVIPVYLGNTAAVCRPPSLWIEYAPVHVVIGPPFTYYEGESSEDFTARVHAWFVAQV